jgi:hypothetical protein
MKVSVDADLACFIHKFSGKVLTEGSSFPPRRKVLKSYELKLCVLSPLSFLRGALVSFLMF